MRSCATASFPGREIAPDAAAVLDYTRDCAAVGVDIPIGLPELGPRSCDLEACRRLDRAASSVFLTPVRGEAGMAIFTCWLLPKIRQWEKVSLPSRAGSVDTPTSWTHTSPCGRWRVL